VPTKLKKHNHPTVSPKQQKQSVILNPESNGVSPITGFKTSLISKHKVDYKEIKKHSLSFANRPGNPTEPGANRNAHNQQVRTI
jgi:hypothetical protein